MDLGSITFGPIIKRPNPPTFQRDNACVVELITEQRVRAIAKEVFDAALAPLIAQLQQNYDEFCRKHGIVNEPTKPGGR